MANGSKRALFACPSRVTRRTHAVAALLAALFAFVVVAHTTAHRNLHAAPAAGWSASTNAPVADASDGALGCALCQSAIARPHLLVLLAPAGVCVDVVRPMLSVPTLPSESGAISSRGPPAVAILPIA